jgi:hypothetical protein
MKNEKDTYIGYVEMALGLGDVVGPAIGGMIFGAMGFVGTFISFGIMIASGIVLSVNWIPASLNLMNGVAEEGEHHSANVMDD